MSGQVIWRRRQAQGLMRVFPRTRNYPQRGEHLGHSSWHQITQDQIDEFAQATGDEQWIHVDPSAPQPDPSRRPSRMAI